LRKQIDMRLTAIERRLQTRTKTSYPSVVIYQGDQTKTGMTMPNGRSDSEVSIIMLPDNGRDSIPSLRSG